MPIELSTKFTGHVDEMFTTESKKSLLTNTNFDWTGAHSIKVYKVTTSDMNDYGRNGPAAGNWSRYGAIKDLDATTQELTLTKDRSFTFAIDFLDEDETQRALQSATALARQLREIAIPEVDAYTYHIMTSLAGHKPAPTALTAANIYDKIIEANNELDNSEVMEVGRSLVVTPDVYLLMKKNKDIIMETDIAQDMRLRGVIAMIDGMNVMKIPQGRLSPDFGFMIAHPVATVAPTKLESYKVHENPPGINGSLVEGRICYDAFVLDSKKNAIFYQEVT